MQTIIWKLFGKKYLLGGVVALYKWLNGKKTALSVAGIVVVYFLKVIGWLPADIADQILALLGGTGGVSLLHKLQKVDTDYKVTQRVAELKEAALEALKDTGAVPAETTATDPLDPAIEAEAKRLISEMGKEQGE